ncbi:MAG TPA: GyrI-like domain-containing protein [Amaricoccus sp.]|uniref:AraC family transcriptional regulator n=1 Tax=Amaricoccus sp. TaxID=1872485 RepID=UPI002C453570|nr:GyrI-like domain-containing protein [Amaricoccus sp.]HMQ95032.1 GyrI-like domain-containing protein [Amaricoccus sp.]HMR54804.1 GyrI-like domain-containing protein [Amaricoccus sp.]HMR62085.1 GyrI-like domain-containing protein [Amaricoccus sp.]HMU01816.1 GyrI-like domain-containing protein [Amaricoccus sp.]
MYQVEIVKRPARRVVGLEHRGAYDAIGGTFERLGPAIEAMGLRPEAIELLAVYFDDPGEVAEADLRAVAGIAVRKGLALPEGFAEAKLASGQHAVLTLAGPYDGLPAAWAWLYREWLPASEFEARKAAPFEVYRNTPGEVAPSELRTEICVPVAKRRGLSRR